MASTWKLAVLLGLHLAFLPMARCEVPLLEIDKGYPAKAYVERLTANFVVPSYPRQKDSVNTYIGLNTNATADPITFLPGLVSYGDPPFPACKAKPGQWCGTADYGNGTRAASIFVPGDRAQMDVQQVTDKLGNRIGYRPSVLRNGKVVDQIFLPQTNPASFVWFVAACYQSGVVPAITYTDITIRLDKRDPDYFKSARIVRSNEFNTPIYTRDGGRTYKIDILRLKRYSCNV